MTIKRKGDSSLNMNGFLQAVATDNTCNALCKHRGQDHTLVLDVHNLHLRTVDCSACKFSNLQFGVRGPAILQLLPNALSIPNSFLRAP